MRTPGLLLILLVMLPCGCRREGEIKVYRVAKEAVADPHGGMPGPGGADPHAGLTPEHLAGGSAGTPEAPVFTDDPPAHWRKQPPSAFLLLKYRIEGADGATVDVTFSSLRSAPGGLLANINRWRGQMGQSSFDDEADLKQGTRTVISGFGDAVFIEVEGLAPGADPTSDGRLMGAIAESGPNAWFFKMRGNAELAAAERERFIAWMASVKPAEASQVPMHGTPPGSETGAPRGSALPATGPVVWSMPEGWTAGAGGSARYATLAVPGGDGSNGEVAVTRFPGDVGGDLANVNRWRGQIGLEPVDESWLASGVTGVAAGTKTIKVVDFSGPRGRCVAGWVAHEGETWFFKFTGSEAVVTTGKEKFLGLLASVRFNGPK